MSQNKYYHDSGINDSQNKANSWSRSRALKAILTELSLNHFKTTDVDVFLQSLRVYTQVQEDLYNLKTRPDKYVKLKFELYVGKTRTIRQFVETYSEAGYEIHINYGNGRWGVSRGRRAVPSKVSCGYVFMYIFIIYILIKLLSICLKYISKS